jgi:hypothetical protein
MRWVSNKGIFIGAGERAGGEDRTYGVVLENARVFELVVVFQGSGVIVPVRLNPSSTRPSSATVSPIPYQAKRPAILLTELQLAQLKMFCK